MNNRIKQIRKHFGLTQTEFASRIGAQTSTVSSWESGFRSPLSPALSMISKTFNVSETWLRTGEGAMFLPEDRDNALMAWVGEVLADESDSFRRRYLNVLRSLTPEDWKRMEAYAEALLLNRPDP